VGEGGLELRFAGLSTVRTVSEHADLSGVSRIGVSDRVSRFYPISTRPVEDPVEESACHPGRRRTSVKMCERKSKRRGRFGGCGGRAMIGPGGQVGLNRVIGRASVARKFGKSCTESWRGGPREVMLATGRALRGCTERLVPIGSCWRRQRSCRIWSRRDRSCALLVPRPTVESLRSRSYATTRCRRGVE
jgi:hypothetical protein